MILSERVLIGIGLEKSNQIQGMFDLKFKFETNFVCFFFASYILQIWLGYPHEFPRRAGEVPDPPSKVQTSPDKESFDKALTKEVFAVQLRDCTQTFLETFDK